MQVDIRRATPDDAASIALVAQATETHAHMIPREEMVAFCAREHGERRYAEWLCDGAHRICIAEAAETGAPVGYAAVTEPDLPIPTGPDDLELKRIYILHRLHGSGVGPELMAWAIEAAQGAGARRLLVGVHAGKKRAQSPSTPARASSRRAFAVSASARASSTTSCWRGRSAATRRLLEVAGRRAGLKDPIDQADRQNGDGDDHQDADQVLEPLRQMAVAVVVVVVLKVVLGRHAAASQSPAKGPKSSPELRQASHERLLAAKSKKPLQAPSTPAAAER